MLSQAPAFSLASTDADVPIRTPPHNYEAEQALLGAILSNNRAIEKVNEFLRPEHFADRSLRTGIVRPKVLTNVSSLPS